MPPNHANTEKEKVGCLGSTKCEMSDQASRMHGLRQKLHLLRVPELRNVLLDLNLQRSGRKNELIDRILEAMETFQTKAAENASNHATSAFYNDQFKAGMRSIDSHAQSSRPQYGQPPSPLPQPLNTARYGQPLPPPAAIAATMHSPSPNQRFPVSNGGSMPHRPHPHTSSNSRYNNHQQQYVAAGQQQQQGGSSTSSYAGILPHPGGTEVYRPTTVPSLQGARCFCPFAAEGKIIMCVICSLKVHAKCHQLITMTINEWYCELCRAKTYDPFLNVQKTVLGTQFVRFAKSSCTFRIEYTVTDNELNDMYAKRDPKPGAMIPGSLELQLRCFALKDELANGHSWPASTQVSVNGFNVPITQRAAPGQANPSKVLRELPANIFPVTRVGRNVIDIRTVENPAIYALMVQIVEIRDINDLIREVKDASASITYEDAKEEVIKSFGDEDEDDIVTTCTILSLRCPLGLCVINLPARGLHCKHLQCFDLRTFLLFSKKARSKAWRCAVCHNFIKATDLRIDPYFMKVLEEVKGEEELEEVEIVPDGSWTRRLAEDTVPAPPIKRMKTEQTETGGATGSTTATEVTTDSTGASHASAIGSNASTPFEIDLSLTSDEEEGDDGNKAASSTSIPTAIPSRSASVSTAQPSNAIALDDVDDMPILPVDDDIWESTPADGIGPISVQVTAPPNGFPFPLNENLFAVDGSNSGGAIDLSSSSDWNQWYPNDNQPAVPVGNGYGNSSWNRSSITPSQEMMNQSEVDLANAMALLSRNNPNVNNSFEQRQRQQQPPLSSSAPKPARQQEALDVIYLLDSDSD